MSDDAKRQPPSIAQDTWEVSQKVKDNKVTWILFKQQMRYIEFEHQQEAEEERSKAFDRMMAYYTAGVTCLGIAGLLIIA